MALATWPRCRNPVGLGANRVIGLGGSRLRSAARSSGGIGQRSHRAPVLRDARAARTPISGVLHSGENAGPRLVARPPAPELEVIVHQNAAGELPGPLILQPVAQHLGPQ